MQDKANRCKPKQKYAKLWKYAPFFAYKAVVLLVKNGQNRRFNLWKCAVLECVWKHPEWILRVFMHFYKGAYDFWTFLFRLYWPFWAFLDHCDHFWRFVTVFGQNHVFAPEIELWPPKAKEKNRFLFSKILGKIYFALRKSILDPKSKKWFLTQNRNNNRNVKNLRWFGGKISK